MDDFDTFKASREKMDPSSRKMTDHQWQQAYAAYRNARERLQGGDASASKRSSSKSRRYKSPSSVRRSSSRRSNRGAEPLGLRQQVRAQSAYADLRSIVDVLFWGAFLLVILSAVVSISFYTSVSASLVALLGAGVQLIAILVVRLLAQVFIDIPDISLFQIRRESATLTESESGSDSEI
jgi:hypothetical protein